MTRQRRIETYAEAGGLESAKRSLQLWRGSVGSWPQGDGKPCDAPLTETAGCEGRDELQWCPGGIDHS